MEGSVLSVMEVAVTLQIAGAVMTAFHLQRALGRRWRVDVWRAYFVTLSCVLVVAGSVVAPWSAFGAPWMMQVIAVPVGLLAGLLAASLDRRLVRRLSRVGAARGPGERPYGGGSARSVRRGHVWAEEWGGREVYGGREDWRGREMTSRAAVGVAVLEEMLFRGVLVEISQRLDGTAGVVMLATSTAWFALTHVGFGWMHVVSKLSLSVAAIAVTLGSGTVLAGIVAHITFNLKVLSERRRRWVVVERRFR